MPTWWPGPYGITRVKIEEMKAAQKERSDEELAEEHARELDADEAASRAERKAVERARRAAATDPGVAPRSPRTRPG